MISNIINGYQTIPFTLKILRVRDYSITIPMLSRTKDKIEMKEPHYTSLAGRNLLVHGIEGDGLVPTPHIQMVVYSSVLFHPNFKIS
jgi:hypothetical protein